MFLLITGICWPQVVLVGMSVEVYTKRGCNPFGKGLQPLKVLTFTVSTVTQL